MNAQVKEAIRQESESKELSFENIDEENKQLIPSDATVTPMSMLQSAREQGASIETMQQLMDMQFKWEKNEARKAYMEAVSAFKATPIKITKDKINSQFSSGYTGIGNLVNTVNPVLSKFGLQASWDIDQTNEIKVTCILSHSMGHSESRSMSAPPDSSGSKNPIQEIKSTITYLKIVTYEAVTGVASTDDPGDTDGNIPSTTITEGQEADINTLIDEVGANKTQFLKLLKVGKLSDLPATKYEGAVKRLQNKRKSK